MITKFKLFEKLGLGVSNIIDKCESYFLINGDVDNVINILESINKENVHDIFGNSLNSNIFDHIDKIILQLKDNFYQNIKNYKGIFIFYTPIYYDSCIKKLTIRQYTKKNEIIEHSNKFLGELKIKDNKLIIDDLLTQTKKYNL